MLLFVQARRRYIFPAREDGEDAVENQTSINHAKREKRLILRSRRFENQGFCFPYLLEVDFIPKSKR